jgi:endonuclease/exonuclease/phosphatase family metal-dependent hydrolase
MNRMERIPVWLVLVAWVAGCASGSPALTAEEKAALDPSREPAEIRFLTINVWSGLDYGPALRFGRLDRDPEDRYRRLLATIRRHDPDVIAIQEAAPYPGYVKRLARDLDCRYVSRLAMSGIRLGPFGLPTNLSEGGAILVRRSAPLTSLGGARLGGAGIVTPVFSLHTSEITQVVSARAVLNGRIVHLYAVHLHNAPPMGAALETALADLSGRMSAEELAIARHSAEEGIARRREEIERLIEHIDETRPAGTPAVILGDFNTTVESGELRPLIVDRGWFDAHRVARYAAGDVTWDPEGNPNLRRTGNANDPYARLIEAVERRPARIDLVLLSPEFPAGTVATSRVVCKPLGDGAASDHYGVLVTIRR